jgi:putative ATP-dependent endonuclease of OLD family
MLLESFSVTGFRSMEDVGPIPLGQPTILTGRNDSGKTAALDALAFLLGDGSVKDGDFRGDAGDGAGQPIIVSAAAVLDERDRQATGLPERVGVRRSAHRDSSRALYEVRRMVPEDVRLRGLEYMSLTKLKETAAQLAVKPYGPATAKESFIRALCHLADGLPACMDWVQADDDLSGRLPKFLRLSGVDAADIHAQLLATLRFTYRRILAEDSFVERVAELQGATEAALAGEVDELCHLIEERCDGLTDVSISPRVSFRDALSGVQVTAKRDGVLLDFDQVGTGRRRQVVQAIWEWSNDQLSSAADEGVSIVIAYDEPDTYLDYIRQRGLMDLVREQCRNPSVRCIVATHSVQMIDQVPLENVVHLELREGATILHRLPDESGDSDTATFVSQLAEELGLATSSVLFERCFLLVEGESEKASFPRLFRLATGQRMQEAGIVLFESGGNGTVLKLVDHLRGMSKPVYVIVDKDSLQNQPKIFKKEVLENHGITPGRISYIGDPNELEELFTDKQWAAVATKFWPRADGSTWQPEQIRALRGNGKFSDKLTSIFMAESGLLVSKPRLVARLADTLGCRDEVPKGLVDAFDMLVSKVAAGANTDGAQTTER